MYKLASNFTIYVTERYPNHASKILSIVDDAINSMFREDDESIPGLSFPAVMSKFHTNPGYSIEQLTNFFNRNMAKYEGELYFSLDALKKNVGPKIRKIIEEYREKTKKPVIVPERAVIKGRLPKKELRPIPNTEPSGPKWEGPENKMIRRLDKDKPQYATANRFDSLLKFASMYASLC